jgi:putative transposase
MVTRAAKREAVAHLHSAFYTSERRASRRAERLAAYERRSDTVCGGRWIADSALWERLRTLAHERRSFGYRRLHMLLKREGYAVNRESPSKLGGPAVAPQTHSGLAWTTRWAALDRTAPRSRAAAVIGPRRASATRVTSLRRHFGRGYSPARIVPETTMVPHAM